MLTGLWHGAAWNFVLWGLLYALFLLAEKWIPAFQKLPARLRHSYTMLVVILGCVLFNAQTLSQAGRDLAAMFGFGSRPLVSKHTLYCLGSFAVLLAVACFGAPPAPKKAVMKLENARFGWVLNLFLMLAALLLCTAYLVDGSFSPFLYFRF